MRMSDGFVCKYLYDIGYNRAINRAHEASAKCNWASDPVVKCNVNRPAEGK